MFENIIGNEPIKKMLEQAITNNKISHSYMFLGISGIGKKMIAREFAIKILEVEDTENIPDLLYIEPDGNSIKIEQIREMQKKVQEKPIGAKRKVYIIDQADKMTSEAQNCLLKTLEEPPEFVTIILIGVNENAFLTTIKSRCMILHFNKIDDEQLKKYLQVNYGMQNITPNMLQMYQGSIGKALNLKDKEDIYQALESLVNKIVTKDLIETTKSAEILYKEKDEVLEMLDYMNILLLKKAKETYEYTNCIQIVENTKKRLKQNANYDMSIDNMLFNICEEIS